MTTKKTMAALTKVFVAEAAGSLPYQSSAAIFEVLADEGLLERMEAHTAGRFPLVVRGYRLTDAGRAMYNGAGNEAR